MWVLSGYRRKDWSVGHTKIYTIVFHKKPTVQNIINKLFPELKDKKSYPHYKFAQKLLKKGKAKLNPSVFCEIEERKPVYGADKNE